jgi:hypothetical protein
MVMKMMIEMVMKIMVEMIMMMRDLPMNRYPVSNKNINVSHDTQ